jgi:hypothetical protein
MRLIRCNTLPGDARIRQSMAGGSDLRVVYVCCVCESDAELDRNALILLNRECPTHGPVWHREMICDEAGMLRLRYSIDQNSRVVGKSRRNRFKSMEDGSAADDSA